MDLFDVIRMIRRQWKVAVAGIVALLLAGVIVKLVVPTSYAATGRAVLLLPAESPGPTGPTNPYLNISSNMTLTASLVASNLSTDEARDQLVADGFPSEYSIALPPDVGPVLDVQARDTDPGQAVRTRDEVMRRIETTLASMQQAVNAPKDQLITIRRIATPDAAAAVPGSKLRALAALGVLIVIVTLTLITLRDRSWRRSLSKRTNVDGPDDTGIVTTAMKKLAERPTTTSPYPNASDDDEPLTKHRGSELSRE